MDKPNFMHTKRGLVRVIPLALTCLVTLTTPVTKYAFFIDEAGVYAVYGEIASNPELIKKGDTVLVKASHSMKFDEISEALKLLK